jgi:hypothetical protein
MELTTLIIVWVLVTTAVVILAYVRMAFGLHDLRQVHLTGDRSPEDPSTTKISNRVQTLDRIGIPLTAVSALLALAILVVWAMEHAGPN